MASTVDQLTSVAERSRRTRRTRSRPRPGVGATISHILVWCYAALLVIPLYYLVLSAFKGNTSIFNDPLVPSLERSFDNFVEAYQNADLGLALRNSLYVTLGAEVVTLVLALPAAYALARNQGWVGNLVERIFALGFLIPAFAAMVSTVLLAIQLGLFHDKTFLIIFYPATAMPISVILLAQFIRTIPLELEESAMMDGASRLTVLLRIVLPLTGPGVATVFILNFLGFWNEYLFALVLAGPDVEERTAQVAVPTLVSLTLTDYGVVAAGTLITMVPVYLAYVLLRRRMEAALLSGAVKM